MKRLALLTFVVLFLAPPAVRAGVIEGEAAFMRSDYATAWKELEPPAQRGDPEAAYWVGVLYSHGAGTRQDLAKAAKWYRTAAEKGYPPARFNLGFLLYREGRHAEAAPWLLAAARDGVAFAQYLTAVLYERGEGLPKDRDAAYGWTLAAADRGVKTAQFNAGLICVERVADRRCAYAEAYKWFAILSKAGYLGAAQNLARISARMSAKEIDRGRALAEGWRALE